MSISPRYLFWASLSAAIAFRRDRLQEFAKPANIRPPSAGVDEKRACVHSERRPIDAVSATTAHEPAVAADPALR